MIPLIHIENFTVIGEIKELYVDLGLDEIDFEENPVQALLLLLLFLILVDLFYL